MNLIAMGKGIKQLLGKVQQSGHLATVGGPVDSAHTAALMNLFRPFLGTVNLQSSAFQGTGSFYAL